MADGWKTSGIYGKRWHSFVATMINGAAGKREEVMRLFGWDAQGMKDQGEWCDGMPWDTQAVCQIFCSQPSQFALFFFFFRRCVWFFFERCTTPLKTNIQIFWRGLPHLNMVNGQNAKCLSAALLILSGWYYSSDQFNQENIFSLLVTCRENINLHEVDTHLRPLEYLLG